MKATCPLCAIPNPSSWRRVTVQALEYLAKDLWVEKIPTKDDLWNMFCPRCAESVEKLYDNYLATQPVIKRTLQPQVSFCGPYPGYQACVQHWRQTIAKFKPPIPISLLSDVPKLLAKISQEDSPAQTLSWAKSEGQETSNYAP